MTTGSPSLTRLASRKSNRCCLVRVVCPRVCNDEWRAGCCDGLKFTALKLLLVLSSIVAFSCALAYYSLFVLGLVDPARLSLDVEHAVKSRLPDIVTRHGDADSNSTDDQTTTTTPAMLLSSINQRVQSQHIFFVLAQFFVSLTALFSLLYCVRVLNYREGATFTIFYAAVLFLVAAVSVVVCFAAPLDMVSTDNTHGGGGGGVGSNTPTATQWPAYSLAPASNAQLEDPFVSVDASTPEVTARDLPLDAPTTTTTGTLAGPAALSTLDVATQYIRNLNLFWCTLVLMFMSLCTLRD